MGSVTLGLRPFDYTGQWVNGADAVGALHFSRAAESDGDFAGFDDDGHLATAVGELEHARKGLVVFEDVEILMGSFAARESLPGTRGVRSEIFSEDKNFFIHVRCDASLFK
jgi:hypothetical protein